MATAAIPGSEPQGNVIAPRGKKQKLSRDVIEQAAITVARTEGFSGLSIRGVAKVLGVAPMALYTHVKNKEEMAEHVADTLLGSIDTRTLGALTWQDRARTLLRAHRDLILKHPEITPFVASAAVLPGPGSTRFGNAVTGVLTQAGFSPEGAQELYFTLMTYNYGSVVTAAVSTAQTNNLLKYNDGLSVILAAYESRMMRPALGLVESMRGRLRFGRK